MKKFFLVLALIVTTLCSAQSYGKYVSDTVIMYKDIENPVRQKVSFHSDLEFSMRNDSALLHIEYDSSDVLLYAKEYVGFREMGETVIYNFLSLDRRQKIIHLALQYLVGTNTLVAVGLGTETSLMVIVIRREDLKDLHRL